jgi:hypothetical protein
MFKKVALMFLLTSSQLIFSSDIQQRPLDDELKPTMPLLLFNASQETLSSDHQVEHVITLAELNDLLERVNEDIDELYYLNRPDTQEIGRILSMKKRAIQEQLKNLEATIRSRENRLFPTWTVKVAIGSSISLAIIATIAGLMASYDAHTGWHTPTSDQLTQNIQKIFS